MISLIVNGKRYQVDVSPDTPLLWVIRENLLRDEGPRSPSFVRGIAAMQSINIAIINPVFLSVFLGTAVGNALVIIGSLLRWHYPSSAH